MKDVYQLRKYEPKQTLSNIIVIENGKVLYECHMIERPWMHNKPNISCYPEEHYVLKKEAAGANGSRFMYDHFEVMNVKDRSEIKWHIANYVSDLRGCGGPGKHRVDLNNDGLIDVSSSGKALQELYDILDDENMLIVIS